MKRLRNCIVFGVATASGALAACAPPSEPAPAAETVGESAAQIGLPSDDSRFVVVGLMGKCLDVDQSVLTPAGNHPAVLQECNGSARQAWRRVSIAGTNQVTFENDALGLCLNVEGAGSANGTPVVVYPCSHPSFNNERWRYEAYTSGENQGAARIVNVGSSKCLNVNGGVSTDGTRLIQYDCAGLPNDTWFHAGVASDKVIRLKPVALADTNGANPSPVTKAQFKALIDEANFVYRRAHIHLDFDDSYWVTRNDTLLNTIQSEATAEQDAAARALAKTPAHKGFVTVLLKHSGGSYSGYSPDPAFLTGDYAALTGAGIHSSLITHELGHYFGLFHTGPFEVLAPHTGSSANGIVFTTMVLGGSPLPNVSLNGDGLSDTPGDPGPWVYQQRDGTGCELIGTSNDAINIFHPATSIVYATPFPDRHNLMSYFDGCFSQARRQSMTPQQIAKVKRLLALPGRNQL
jgi:hypothetical protein